MITTMPDLHTSTAARLTGLYKGLDACIYTLLDDSFSPELYWGSNTIIPDLHTSSEALLTVFRKGLYANIHRFLAGSLPPDLTRVEGSAFRCAGLESTIPLLSLLPSRATDSQEPLGELDLDRAKVLFTVAFALFARMMHWLKTVGPPRSIEIELESLVKDIERSETQDEAWEKILQLMGCTKAHIGRLSRIRLTTNQHLEASKNVAAANAKIYSPLP